MRVVVSFLVTVAACVALLIGASPALAAGAGEAAIAQAYAAPGVAATLGAPATAVICGLKNSGCYQAFQGGSIHWTSTTGAHPTQTAIRTAWINTGTEKGYLGYPTTDQKCGLKNGGCYQAFQGGSIHWTSTTGAHPTQTAIRTAWINTGTEKGYLGYPTTDQKCGLKNSGCYQAFQGGSIHWTSTTGAHPTQTAIRTAWINTGTEKGYLGYPTTDQSCSNGICRQSFQGGSITWTSSGGAKVVYGAVVVNKKRPLVPIDYAPSPIQTVGSVQLQYSAAVAAQSMISAAAASGVKITTVSGYRDYWTQKSLYQGYVQQYGQAEADLISARPGYSEHQSGLAMDIGDTSGSCSLQSCFENTAAGAWARKNAWRYGFIIRYPNGYTGTTGYAYEPWHLRYVGKFIATDMTQQGIPTLEQYFHLPAAPNY
ncbi:D-alanyl-D-alanine carboxypeptidase [Psychromicrobium silvestre]|uniref:D-alanyl-D-alanine carboxypeptidase n=1 Tax=Psychromicrobium silvestre TaxID=1645614 RepID=A0A7Y9S797_9MICC|nr:D-alanyl-D-alanine carboxypeptidase family protein [Psychromicrobium silvestre]NYE94522.1 D-alanyl-D-alanine carboxypeptidase [Psychromicrobium silvestre]